MQSNECILALIAFICFLCFDMICIAFNANQTHNQSIEFNAFRVRHLLTPLNRRSNKHKFTSIHIKHHFIEINLNFVLFNQKLFHFLHLR